MRVVKVFNNSVVLAEDEHGTEQVLLGRGIGFQTGRGAPIDAALVEKRFTPGPAAPAERLAAFLDEIPLADIEATEEVVAAARTALGDHVSDHVLVPLADHVSFALRRAREGAPEIDYPLRWEVQHLYPAEVAFSREALGILERRTGVRLPDLEAVPLALHFVNARFGVADLNVTVQMTEVLAQALAVVREAYGVDVDETSVEVARFVTHLRYLFLRAQQGTQPEALSDDGLHAALREARPRAYECGRRIAGLLAERFGREVDPDEGVYLALHVTRLVATSPAAGEDAGHG